MKIAYFVNSFNAINWGGQATSNGIKYLINKNYPDAKFYPLDMPRLPFQKIKILRKFFEYKLYDAIMSDDTKKVYKYLDYFSIKENFFDGFTHICFNGEGAIHSNSGHFIVLMSLLYIAKKQNLYVASINQTIDLRSKPKLEKLLVKVYSSLDFVSAREPISQMYAISLGLDNINLIPDAAYGIPKLSSHEIDKIVNRYNLPEKFVGITGSSMLKRDKKSLNLVSKVIETIRANFDIHIIFLANAKTDIWIAKKLSVKYRYTIIEPPVKYIDAIAIISKASFIVGGRQHPNIFAYEYGVPYIPFSGNTQKNLGVAKLQNYPIEPLNWECSQDELIKSINSILTSKIEFNEIKIDNFKIFKE